MLLFFIHLWVLPPPPLVTAGSKGVAAVGHMEKVCRKTQLWFGRPVTIGLCGEAKANHKQAINSFSQLQPAACEPISCNDLTAM